MQKTKTYNHDCSLHQMHVADNITFVSFRLLSLCHSKVEIPPWMQFLHRFGFNVPSMTQP